MRDSEGYLRSVPRGFGNLMLTLWQDLRFAMRVLQKAPGFSAVAILTLALGIGANTAGFSAVAETFPPFPEASISYPNFLDWTRMNHTFEGLAAYRQTNFNLTGSGEAQRLSGVQATASFFSLLGVQPLMGRDFLPEDDKKGAAPVVMLSEGFWNNKFGGSPEILGKMLTLDGTGYTVVGVIPRNFYFCCESINFHLGDVYVPIGSGGDSWLTERGFHPGIRAVGRMKPGVTLAQAQADVNEI